MELTCSFCGIKGHDGTDPSEFCIQKLEEKLAARDREIAELRATIAGLKGRIEGMSDFPICPKNPGR